MTFRVTRTSASYTVQPCAGARKGDYEGEWLIDIGSIAELLAFVGRNGRLVIEPPDAAVLRRHTIEIYDDYRE